MCYFIQINKTENLNDKSLVLYQWTSGKCQICLLFLLLDQIPILNDILPRVLLILPKGSYSFVKGTYSVAEDTSSFAEGTYSVAEEQL